jgi:hypothetical protein
VSSDFLIISFVGDGVGERDAGDDNDGDSVRSIVGEEVAGMIDGQLVFESSEFKMISEYTCINSRNTIKIGKVGTHKGDITPNSCDDDSRDSSRD